MPRKADFEQGQLAELLRRQHGVIGRDQALGCGLTKKALAYRIRAGGPWQRLLPGVYLAGTGTASAQQRDVAALLHAGPRSVLTGLAAVRRHSLRVGAPSVVTVLVPAGVRRQSTGFVQIQRTARMPVEFCVDGAVRFVLAARAVGDAARSLRSSREVRALVAQAIQQQRCSIAMLVDELEQGPTKGSGLLRAALAEVEAGVRSVPEGDLRGLLRRAKVPEPQFNARLYVGRELVAVADAWWEEAGVVAEVDSRAYHYSVEDWQRTMRRHDRLVAQGVLLLHFTPAQIRTAPEEVVGQVRAALAAGRGRAPLAITGRRR
ncbi:MAG TPA: type IV toxin-antitoxin system AbiEi family antitoxin domain-containing protein [Streptosporangiaceae bacterium]